MNKTKILVALILASMALAACGSANTGPTPAASPSAAVSVNQNNWEAEWNKILDQGKKEGKIVLYTSVGGTEIRPAIANAFKSRYGIEVEFVVGKGEEIVAKLTSERAANLFLADAAIIGAPSQINFLKPQGILDPMKPALVLPEVTDTKSWIGGSLPFVDEAGQIFGFVAGYRSYLTINTEMVKQGDIKSYKDLLDPKWKGKLSLFDPSVGGSGNEWVSGVMRAYGQDGGVKYLKDMAKQEPVITRDGRLQIEWVARGIYPVGIATRWAKVSDFRALGAPLEWVDPVEGGTLSSGTGNLGLINKAAHPNAAKVFVNWLLGKEGQAIFVKGFGSPSARLDVSTEGLDPDTVATQSKKFYLVDEKLYLQYPQLAEMARGIFADQLK